MSTPLDLRQFQHQGYSFEEYVALSTQLFKEGKSTSTPAMDEPEILDYIKLNLQRMQRVLKTTELSAELQEVVRKIKTPQLWLVLTESWCGDAAQTVPLFHLMAQQNPLITTVYLLRDKTPVLMDAYLQNGKSRSIPKLIIADASTGEGITHWGPRPQALQTIYSSMLAKGDDFNTIKHELHSWYAKDKTSTSQQELYQLLKAAETATN
ncbi:MAG: thioredoxin family protein [Bacteroidetes bacterium]|nr:MAG: thioredoxin family protein [Bacteroidota bacterium]TAE63560.1 MAG: thioredoxin family protein [Bacteroidota bacterium]